MSRRRDERGFAMLAALVVMVMAAAFALVIVAAVSGMQAVETSDASVWRGDALIGEALHHVAGRLRWSPAARSGVAESSGAPARRGSWVATWSPASAVDGDLWPRLRARFEAAAGRARRRVDAGVELRTEPWACGIVCAGDAAVEAPLVVEGSGVYVGGSLRGRENVGFAQGAGPVAPGGAPPDLVHPDRWAAAAVHAGGGIFAHGAEIHESSDGGLFPCDTDVHTGGLASGPSLAPPSAEFLAAAVEHCVPLGGAFGGTTLRLDRLDLPEAGIETDAGGWCVLTPPVDQVEISGLGPDDGTRLLVVVPGDAVIGDVAEETSFAGGLVVCGQLEVRGELSVAGSVYASDLVVSGPTRVVIAPLWRLSPTAGACLPVVSELGG